MPPPSPRQRPRDAGRQSRAERAAAVKAERQAAQAAAKQRRRLLVFGGAVAAALVVAAVLIALNRPADTGAPIVAAAPLPASVPASGNSMGDASAEVQAVEWGDYQCPGCGIFAQEVAPRLIEAYVEPGLISFQFRDFAFLGEESFRAAEAAACAADQGAFWPFHDTLYANQQGENQHAFSDARLKQSPAVLDLDTGVFDRCLDSGEKRAAVVRSAAEAREQGILSTPSLLINGTKVEDWRNWEAVSAAIDEAIAAE